MYSFGPKAPRALQSFGVAGLLEEECTIFYENLFSSRHVGRVSDLIAARLKSAGFDELKLRAVLLFGIFEGIYNPGQDSSDAGPVTVECGIDGEKMAVGLSFLNRDLADRLAKGETGGVFGKLLIMLHSNADRVLVRVGKESGKIEIVSLIGIPGKMSMDALKEHPSVEKLFLNASMTLEAASAKEYVLLGDLDYPALLKEENPLLKLPQTRTGIVLPSMAEIPDPVARFKGEREALNEEQTVVKGEFDARNEEKLTVSGTTERRTDEVIRVKAGQEPTPEEMNFLKVVGGAGLPPVALQKVQDHFRRQASEYQSRLQSLEAQLKAVKAERLSLSGQAQTLAAHHEAAGIESPLPPAEPVAEEAKGESAVSEPPAVSAAVETESKVMALLPKFLRKAFKKSAADLPAEPTASSEVAEPAGSAAKNEHKNTKTADAAAGCESEVEELKTEGLEKIINKAAVESREIRKEVGGDRAKLWMDGMMGELVAEKSHLLEKAKQVNMSMRQKELDFKNRQMTLNEELKRREEGLRQRDHLIARLKDQISEMTMSIERSRGGAKGAADASRYKQRAEISERVLSTTKSENTQLRAKVDELRGQLTSLQAAKQVGTVTAAELSAIRVKYEHAARQAEEFRKTNAQLNDKLAQVKREKTVNGGTADELKRRLELAMNAATSHQKDADEQRLKAEELKREELRLKMELGKATTEIKALRAAVAKVQQAPGAGNGKPGGSRAA